MVLFFQNPENKIIAVQTNSILPADDLEKLKWLFGGAEYIDKHSCKGGLS
jgi:hypothetical protein